MENQLLLILFSFILAFSLIIYIDIPYFFNFPLYPIFLCLFFSCPSFYSVLNSFTVFPRSIFSTFYLFSSTLQKKTLFYSFCPSQVLAQSTQALPFLRFPLSSLALQIAHLSPLHQFQLLGTTGSPLMLSTQVPSISLLPAFSSIPHLSP